MTVTPRIRVGYALGSLATGAFATVPGLLLLPFLTDRLAVPAAVAGVLVLVPKAWDVAFNPIAGRISDRATHRLGPRRPFLLRGGLALAALFAVMFLPPLFGTPLGDGAWVAVSFLACATAFAFFQVPYVAMAAELTDDYHDRTRLIAWRVAALAIAILLCGAGAPLLRDSGGGYRVMALAVALLIVVGTLGVYIGTATAPVARVTPTGARFPELLAAVRSSRPFRLLLLTFVIQAVGIGTLLAGVDYLSRVVLQDPGAQTLLFAAFVAPALLVVPVWQVVGRRWGKRVGYQVASVLFAVSIGLVVFVPAMPVLVGLVGVAGVAYAGLQVFPMAMLPDIISAEERRAGVVRAGVFSGVWTAGETAGLALGPGVFGGLLGLGGYVSGGGVQGEGVRVAVVVGFSVVPAVLVGVTVGLLSFVEGERG
ncbi:MFS transporter [Actinokineospora cianjurensis]|uniref:Na+/melibiose symporter-like transporter n=1 Tax=Actinokineospora cianjurensis TaxID=585224 RepID=A0A421BD51_9PSEU|nr:MFS transporter [Actinokineospora cianjurensis]RLK62299.1 Na+/melibiose symporter-like transporter [Actinokineospora cianjurensis]